jgi:hypothetical protein
MLWDFSLHIFFKQKEMIPKQHKPPSSLKDNSKAIPKSS